MNINKDILNELLADPKKIESISLNSLEELAAKFPYFIGIQKLINNKKKLIEVKANVYNFVSPPATIADSFKNNNNNFDKEDDEEFTELEIEEKELPFENFELEDTDSDISSIAPNQEVAGILNNQQITTLQTLAGSSYNYYRDDLSLLPHLSENIIDSLSRANITSYQQLINISERNGNDVFSKILKFSKANTETIIQEATNLVQNKYQKLLIEELGYSNYKNKNDLKQVVGIGNLTANKLNTIGIFTLQQLTNLNEANTEILTVLIDYFPQRIERDNWQQQAQQLINAPDKITVKQSLKPAETIEDLTEKLALRKINNLNFAIANETMLNAETVPLKTFSDWLNTFAEKKNHLNDDMEIVEPTIENLKEEQPRLVKVNEDNLKDIHTFLGNKVEEYQPSKPVFEFLAGFSVKEVAAKSLDENHNIVSITLAKIYEQQQYFDKAIHTYEKLILKYPEKSSFFASQIIVLKEKI